MKKTNLKISILSILFLSLFYFACKKADSTPSGTTTTSGTTTSTTSGTTSSTTSGTTSSTTSGTTSSTTSGTTTSTTSGGGCNLVNNTVHIAGGTYTLTSFMGAVGGGNYSIIGQNMSPYSGIKMEFAGTATPGTGTYTVNNSSNPNGSNVGLQFYIGGKVYEPLTVQAGVLTLSVSGNTIVSKLCNVTMMAMGDTASTIMDAQITKP